MRVVALVGKSGTGKSYRALTLAYEKEINYIIDDGLFIKGSKIIAGKSAKREKTTIAAVKRALFMQKKHRQDVVQKIVEHGPDSILILGTSVKMVNRIVKNLQIEPIQEIVYIDQIATKEEIRIATESRQRQGKHVIPVPTFELKKDFSGYFVDRLKIFRRKKDNTLQISEKSVVRPTFSYMGKFTIYDRAIAQMVNHVARDIKSIYRINKIKIINYPSGITINIDLILEYGFKIPEIITSLQKLVKIEVEAMTSLNILAVNISIKGLKIKY